MSDPEISNSVPASPPSPPDSAPRDFIEVWAASISEVLGQITGKAFPLQSPAQPAPGPPPATATDLHLLIAASGSLRGEMSLRLPQSLALALAQTFIAEPLNEAAEFKPENREANEELFRQVGGQVATALKPRWGEVQLVIASGAPPSWAAGASGWLIAGEDVPFKVAIEWQVSAALSAALAAAQANAAPAQDAVLPLPPDTNALDRNLSLLMDVELELSLRFGERTLRLKEVLELGPGSVVELDRKVLEPVELLLDGKLIARGEVVVVDGNYGLRVSEIATPLDSAKDGFAAQ